MIVGALTQEQLNKYTEKFRFYQSVKEQTKINNKACNNESKHDAVELKNINEFNRLQVK